MRLRNLLYKEATVQRFKRNQKEARVHFILNLKNGDEVNLCAPVVIKDRTYAVEVQVASDFDYLSLTLLLPEFLSCIQADQTGK
ncbi:hypothetical protein MCM1_0195 [Methanosarcina barkeri CM1]|uniref:Uncharacterized protein n=1 Tax=Methanosarcina barkeri CM1 TaxID=796385 RepID=A0A0G3CDX2_METBA|nr:hypothetical protein MCM1_0195 [Methanosarcina barkeri CM1]